MNEQEWEYSKPPNEEVVEVEDNGKIIKVYAFWGRDGYLPHWRSVDGNIHYHSSYFRRWRRVVNEPTRTTETTT